ncbi:MAG TPA: AMP-binding protein, partial [Acidimicrobiia bacterium]|nr:AMP-binding protein [Acidimicrobiia bacterium]
MTTVSASSYLRSAIDARRLMKARRLLHRAQSNPFYAPRLAGCSVTADNLHTLAQWRDLPVVDKTSFLSDQEQQPPYGTRLGVDPSAIRQVHLTSGTSGFGQEAFALTDDDLDTAGALWRHAFDAMALAPGDLFVTFYPITFLAYGRSVLEGGRVTGVPIMSMAGLDRSAAVALMRRLQPAAIGARPALFGLLREELEADGLTARDAFPHLRAVVCSGLTPAAAAAIEAEWGVTIHEVYGSSQAGGIAAATGPEGAVPGGEAGVMQVIEDHFLVEAVDPKTLEPVEEGEAELLLTCFDRVASPVIRFRTGDRVDVVPPGAHGDRRGPLGLRVGSV